MKKLLNAIQYAIDYVYLTLGCWISGTILVLGCIPFVIIQLIAYPNPKPKPEGEYYE